MLYGGVSYLEGDRGKDIYKRGGGAYLSTYTESLLGNLGPGVSVYVQTCQNINIASTTAYNMHILKHRHIKHIVFIHRVHI